MTTSEFPEYGTLESPLPDPTPELDPFQKIQVAGPVEVSRYRLIPLALWCFLTGGIYGVAWMYRQRAVLARSGIRIHPLLPICILIPILAYFPVDRFKSGFYRLSVAHGRDDYRYQSAKLPVLWVASLFVLVVLFVVLNTMGIAAPAVVLFPLAFALPVLMMQHEINRWRGEPWFREQVGKKNGSGEAWELCAGGRLFSSGF